MPRTSLRRSIVLLGGKPRLPPCLPHPHVCPPPRGLFCTCDHPLVHPLTSKGSDGGVTQIADRHHAGGGRAVVILPGYAVYVPQEHPGAPGQHQRARFAMDTDAEARQSGVHSGALGMALPGTRTRFSRVTFEPSRVAVGILSGTVEMCDYSTDPKGT